MPKLCGFRISKLIQGSIMKRICIYAGSSSGSLSEYRESARELGRVIAADGSELVYGGGNLGLMGETAGAVLDGGSRVTGVITEYLAGRIKKLDNVELIIVNSMHERKQRMFDLSDAFIALPGGLGTLEEIFEVLTWAQLGLHGKPVGLLNIAGYYNNLLCFLDKAVEDSFLKQAHREMILSADNCTELLSLINGYRPVKLDKWI